MVVPRTDGFLTLRAIRGRVAVRCPGGEFWHTHPASYSPTLRGAPDDEGAVLS